MARTYAKLMVSISTDPDFCALTETAQRFYLLLLANPKLSSAGCIPYQPTKWVRWASDSTPTTVACALEELEARHFILTDQATEEVLIRSFIRHDGGWKNPKMLKGVQSTIGSIESEALRIVAEDELTKCLVDRPSIDDQSPFDGQSIESGSTTDSNYSLKPEACHSEPSTLQPPTVVESALKFISEEQRTIAAAAFERWIIYRLRQKDVKVPMKLEATLRNDAPTEWHPKLAEYMKDNPAATVDDVLYDVFRLTPGLNRRTA